MSEKRAVRITAAHEARAVALITQDVQATLGVAEVGVVRHLAAMRREFLSSPETIQEGWDEYLAAVAEEVQQFFHDAFVDSTWPECPFHHRHPLWLHDGGWLCEQSGLRAGSLGELKASRDATGRYRILPDGDTAPAV